MPVGTIGELLVEGPTLARGYLNNEQKTQEVFITNPAWSITEGGPQVRRMYKTGDLVKMLPTTPVNCYMLEGRIVKLSSMDSDLSSERLNTTSMAIVMF